MRQKLQGDKVFLQNPIFEQKLKEYLSFMEHSFITVFTRIFHGPLSPNRGIQSLNRKSVLRTVIVISTTNTHIPTEFRQVSTI